MEEPRPEACGRSQAGARGRLRAQLLYGPGCGARRRCAVGAASSWETRVDLGGPGERRPRLSGVWGWTNKGANWRESGPVWEATVAF